jgi:hypothetical protein
MFLHSQSIKREDLRSAVITRFIARPLRHSGPHHRDAAIPEPPFTLALVLGYFHCGQFPKSSLIVARLVTCLPLCSSMLSETPGGRNALVFDAHSMWPAPPRRGSAHTQNNFILGAKGQIQGTHPSPRYTHLSVP